MKSTRSLGRLSVATIIIGIVAGLGGMVLVLLLHYIQHLAYRYSLDRVISEVSFFEGVSSASSLRRVGVLGFCGVIAGCGWWLIFRFGKPLVSIAAAVSAEKPSMPILTTIAHAFLQIITIALGSPLGREVAPRELGATFAIWLANQLHLSVRETQILLSCGAGAGLAAVYNIPFSGALFTLEVLLCTFRWQAVVPAFVTATIATLVAWLGLGNVTQYPLPDMTLNASLMIWSIFVGPMIGVVVHYFNRLILHARAHAPHDKRLVLLCCLNFTVIGLMAVYFPALLGNGRSPILMGFNVDLSIHLAFVLLLLRILVVWSSLRAGAYGGLLTPSLANGALLAVALGGIWHIFFPGSPQAAYAVIGATAFLGASQKMPITAVVLIFEFTHMRFNLLMPILFAVTGAVAVAYWMDLRLCGDDKL